MLCKLVDDNAKTSSNHVPVRMLTLNAVRLMQRKRGKDVM